MQLYKCCDYLESNTFPFHIGLYEVHPNHQLKLHSHEFIEFVYIVEGRGIHHYNGMSYPISEGDVFLIEPYIEHTYRVISESKIKVYNILFEKSLLDQELLAVNQSVPIDLIYLTPFIRSSVIHFQTYQSLSPLEKNELCSIIHKIIYEYEHKPPGYRMMIKSQLLSVFIYLSRYCKRITYGHIDNRLNSIESIVDFIDSHYSHPLTLSDMSRLCGMSTSSFTEKFKSYTGKTFVEYRNHVRIQNAKKWLYSTNDKIIEIAQRTGFDDISYFNKLFKQHLGVNPSEYRERTGKKMTVKQLK